MLSTLLLQNVLFKEVHAAVVTGDCWIITCNKSYYMYLHIGPNRILKRRVIYKFCMKGTPLYLFFLQINNWFTKFSSSFILMSTCIKQLQQYCNCLHWMIDWLIDWLDSVYAVLAIFQPYDGNSENNPNKHILCRWYILVMILNNNLVKQLFHWFSFIIFFINSYCM